MNLLINFATRQRPKRFLEVLDMYVSRLTSIDYKILVSADCDDLLMNNNGMIASIYQRQNCYVRFADNKTKIEAINAHVGDMDWQVLLNASDDMIPTERGYDDIIRFYMQHCFPQGDGCLWFYDGKQARTCTLSLMDRKYFERDGYVYHPSYKTEYCDNEFTEVALKRERMVYIPQTIVSHENYSVGGKFQRDELDRKNKSLKKQDKINYLQRKSLNFPK